MIIVLDEGYRPDVGDRFAHCDVRYFSAGLTEQAAFADVIRHAQALGLRRALPLPFDRGLIEQLTNLQFVHKSGSGADWFDLPALSDHGVLVAVNTGFNASSVAEHAVMLILMSLRNAFGFMERLRGGTWQRETTDTMPMLLSGKTVGIIGMGAIGSGVARAVTALGGNVTVHQRSPLPAWATAAGIEAASLDELLAQSDIVSLHMPHTPETEGMIGAAELARMKPTAILVNTARGMVVDERALYEALRERRIRGAAIDVFEQEPTPADNPLLRLDNVVVTPHVGGVAAELGPKQAEGTLSNIERFVSGYLPERLVNRQVFDSGRARAAHLVPVSD